MKPPRTWGEFKRAVEAAGYTDDSAVIDVEDMAKHKGSLFGFNIAPDSEDRWLWPTPIKRRD